MHGRADCWQWLLLQVCTEHFQNVHQVARGRSRPLCSLSIIHAVALGIITLAVLVLGAQHDSWPFLLATLLADMIAAAAKVGYRAHACSQDISCGGPYLSASITPAMCHCAAQVYLIAFVIWPDLAGSQAKGSGQHTVMIRALVDASTGSTAVILPFAFTSEEGTLAINSASAGVLYQMADAWALIVRAHSSHPCSCFDYCLYLSRSPHSVGARRSCMRFCMRCLQALHQSSHGIHPDC